MKIFQLIQKNQLRGAEIFAVQLSAHLIRLGHTCTLFTLYEGDAQLPFSGEIVNLNRPLNKRLWDMAGWKQLAGWINEHQPAVIQANAGDTLKFAVLSKRIFGWKTPIVFRNANLMSDFIDTRVKFQLNRFLLNQVDHIISVSEACRKDLIDYFKYPVAKITTVEIGINLNKIGGVPADVMPWFQRGQVFINVASFVPEKNHEGLLRIFSKIQHRYPTAQLLLIGKGKGEERVKQQIGALELADHVHLLGYRTDVLEIMQACTAFLLPSKIEGLPGVVLEAMYARCPVVAYQVGGIGEVVTDQVTGRLIAKDDEQAYVEAVISLLEQKEQAEKIRDVARDQVIARFDNAEIAKRFATVYEQLIG